MWLEGDKDFKVGLEIYKTIPHADYVMFFSKQSDDPGFEAKSLLEGELIRANARYPELFLGELPVIEEKVEQPPFKIADAGKIVKVIRGSIKPEEMPADIRAIYDANGVISKTITGLKKKVDDKETPEDEAQKLLELLIQSEDSYNDNWDIIDAWYYETINLDPEKEKKMIAIKVIKLVREQSNFKNYIKKFKTDEVKCAEYQGKLDIVNKTLDELTGGAKV